MTEQEFATLMRFLSASIAKPISEETIEAWYQLLGDLPYQLAKMAFKKVLTENQYQNLPPIGLIRRAAIDIQSGPRMQSAEAWGLVLRAIKRYGIYRKKEALESLPPDVAKIVEWLGWTELCNAENIEVIRAQFCRAYEANEAREKDMAILPPDVRKVITGTAERLAIEGGSQC